jgi:hypothetical protein
MAQGGEGARPMSSTVPPIAGYDKPTSDQVLAWIAEAIDRGQRSNINTPEALASMVVRELRAHSVKLVVHRFD